MIGEVLLVQPVSYYVVSFSLAVTCFVVLIAAATAEYSEVESARGFIVPSSGELRVLAERDGEVSDVLVEDGDQVSEGQQLLVVATDVFLGSGADATTELTTLVEQKLDLLEADKEIATMHANSERESTLSEIRGLERVLAVLDRQIDLKNQVVKSEIELSRRAEQLHGDGHLSEADVRLAATKLLTERHNLQGLRREKEDIQRDRSGVVARLERLPAQERERQNNIEKERLDLELQLANLRRTQSYSVVAPASGIVTALQARRGQHVEHSIPLMALVKEGSQPEVELFVSSRAAGFLEAGQTVDLRVDSYPYQSYGTVAGKVIAISKTAMYPDEIKSPFRFDSPVFPVRLGLDGNIVKTQRGEVLLSSGMTVAVVIKLETTTLLRSIVAPLIDLSENL